MAEKVVALPERPRQPVTEWRGKEWMRDHKWVWKDDVSIKPGSLWNLRVMVEHHPSLKGMFVHDDFRAAIYTMRGLPGDEDDVAIVQSIILLARQLRLEVVAEGVETPAQRDFLRALGCQAMQGYLFSRPVAAAAFEALLQAGGAPAAPPA